MDIELKSPFLQPEEISDLYGGLDRLSLGAGVEGWLGGTIRPGQKVPVLLQSKGRSAIEKLHWRSGDEAFEPVRAISYGRRCLVPIIAPQEENLETGERVSSSPASGTTSGSTSLTPSRCCWTQSAALTPSA